MSAKSENDAEILLYGVIGGYDDDWQKQDAKAFIKKVQELGNVSNMTIRINSVGGSVFEAQAMYNYLKTHRATKTIRIDGLAASAATLVAMVGDRIIMPDNALMMIHNPSTIVWGTSEEMRNAADHLDKVRDTMVAVYRAKSGKEAEELESMMNVETWMTAAEALEHGFCDETDEEIEIAACAALDCDGLVIKTAAGETPIPQSIAEKMPHILEKLSQNKVAAELSNHSNPAKEADTVEFRTIAELEAAAPDLVKEIRSQAATEAHTAGVTDERSRIQALDSLVKPGREAIIAKAKYEDPKDARDIALALLDADQVQSKIDSREADAKALENLTDPQSKVSEAEKRADAENTVADIINDMRGYKK